MVLSLMVLDLSRKVALTFVKSPEDPARETPNRKIPYPGSLRDYLFRVASAAVHFAGG
jgi:hypothetical protein